MSEAGVALRGVRRLYGERVVLDGIDLSIRRGGTLAILGASGSGKTTLLRVLAGFDRAGAGTVAIDGRTVDGPGGFVPAERRPIGYVAQEGALFPHLSVGGNVLFGLSRAERRDTARAAALLEAVGLPASFAGRSPALLSGGEQQRVALARALARRPSLVLLDEPFSALDASLRADTRRAVLAALRDAGATGVLVTHDQAEALSSGEQVAVLRAGRLAQVADPATLYRRPATPALARFVGEAVLLPGTVSAGAVSCALGRLPLAAPAADGPALAMIRPEQIRIGAVGFAAIVEAVEFFGPDASLRLRVGDTAVACRLAGHLAPRPGETVAVSVEGAVMAWPAAGPHAS